MEERRRLEEGVPLDHHHPMAFAHNGVSPRFLNSLQLLVQAHIEELNMVASSAKGSQDTTPAHTLQVPLAQFMTSLSGQCQRSGAGEAKQEALGIGTLELVPQAAEPPLTPRSNDSNIPVIKSETEVKSAVSSQGLRGRFSFNAPVSNRNRMAGSVGSDGSGRGLFPHKNGRSSIVELVGLGEPAVLDEVETDVSQYYHTEGYAQAVARSGWFGYLTLTVISANAVYMGIDADYNSAPSLNVAEWWCVLMENIFCIFFTGELLIRFCAFEAKCKCFKDAWFKFDGCLLVVIWVETWIVPLCLIVTGADSDGLPIGPLRLFRLLRLARLVRIMRAFPELVTMIQGMLVATRAVGSAMLLLVIAIYAWGITMHSLLKDDEDLYEYWGTVLRCMMTLMGNGTLGDSIGQVMRDIARNVPAFIMLIFFIIFSALTVLNMLIGVLCEIVAEVSHAEQDAMVLSKLKSTLLVMLQSVDEDRSGDISRSEVVGLLEDEAALVVMDDLNINASHFVDMLEMHYHCKETLTISEIMKLLLDNQGGKAVTVQDLCAFDAFNRWSMRNDMTSVQDELGAFQTSLQAMEQGTQSMCASVIRNTRITGRQTIDSTPIVSTASMPSASEAETLSVALQSPRLRSSAGGQAGGAVAITDKLSLGSENSDQRHLQL